MAVQRFANGVSTAASTETLASFGMPDPTKWSVYFCDFNDAREIDATNQWVITTTEAGAGDATEVISDASYGELLITNDAADDDNDFFQSKYEIYKFTAGKELFFKAKFKVSDATQSDFVMGLQVRDTSPLAVSDGVWFQKDDGDANLDFHMYKSSAATDVTAITTLQDATYITVGYYYDGLDSVEIFIDDVSTLTVGVTNLPTTELTISFGIQNGAAAAKTMTVDYIFVACER